MSLLGTTLPVTPGKKNSGSFSPTTYPLPGRVTPPSAKKPPKDPSRPGRESPRKPVAIPGRPPPPKAFGKDVAPAPPRNDWTTPPTAPVRGDPPKPAETGEPPAMPPNRAAFAAIVCSAAAAATEAEPRVPTDRAPQCLLLHQRREPW
jgi:hypothetical protein